ncbi:von Willebrand factor A domain-containing protein 3A [Lonchura striata]|uniref:von Willebrand factor A domain-containing protein 3A n=1 Tax=Lonchura striata TaxID=40157 RepID=A0A218V8E6_9PASE|nr:von Willebrand factor A domain-containing protein 3A [Lonchura striata domestica]
MKAVIKNLAEAVGGHYHCYSSKGEKVMTQFEWYDGTVKNIHVDVPVLYNYQKLLAKMVRIYEKRIDWLSVASRRIWGSVCERRVVVLVDISVTNSTYISHIQDYLRLLLEEQMSNKDYFNIIAWVLGLECKGSRNFMSALRRAVEVDFKDKDKHKSQGLYLLTTGIPDQETHTISAYVAEACRGLDLQLHVCLFSVTEGTDSSGIIPARYASPRETAIAFKEIVQAANGRFHWFGEAGIFESDDITSIISEMEKAKNYSQKVLKDVKDSHCAERNTPVRVLAWRPPSAKAGIPPDALVQTEFFQGVVKHLHFQPKELETYTEQLEKVLQRYIQRVQWLLSGSRRLFGTILEANVCVLIDTSGSMGPYLPPVTKELTSLIWEQLRKNEARFNLLRFAENTESWKENLVEATDESCHDAVQWASTCHAHGNSCILAALQYPVFPYFEGDDLKKLTEEVAKARSFLKQAKSWR